MCIFTVFNVLLSNVVRDRLGLSVQLADFLQRMCGLRSQASDDPWGELGGGGG